MWVETLFHQISQIFTKNNSVNPPVCSQVIVIHIAYILLYFYLPQMVFTFFKLKHSSLKMWDKFRSLIYNHSSFTSLHIAPSVYTKYLAAEERNNIFPIKLACYPLIILFSAVQSLLTCPQSTAKTEKCLNFNMCLNITNHIEIFKCYHKYS